MTTPTYLLTTDTLRERRDDADERYRALLLEAERARIECDRYAEAIRGRERVQVAYRITHAMEAK